MGEIPDGSADAVIRNAVDSSVEYALELRSGIDPDGDYGAAVRGRLDRILATLTPAERAIVDETVAAELAKLAGQETVGERHRRELEEQMRRLEEAAEDNN